MELPALREGEFYLPVTPEQFEKLTNELLVTMNQLGHPQAYGPDFFAEVVMREVHSGERKCGTAFMPEFFSGCVRQISCRLTHHIVEQNRAKLAAQAEAAKVAEADNVTPITSAPDAQVI